MSFSETFRNRSVLSINIQVGQAPPCLSLFFVFFLFFFSPKEMFIYKLDIGLFLFYLLWPTGSFKLSIGKYKRGNTSVTFNISTFKGAT